jgi:hypothetical protein
MPGKDHRLTPLEARKQLLLVESEVNRAQLLNDCTALRTHLDGLSSQARSVSDSLQASMALVHDGINRMRETVAGFGEKKSSLLSGLINGIKIATALWKTFRPRS